VLDCFSKKVVGYAMAEHMRTALVADTLRGAARIVAFRHGQTIFHSDRGCQYVSAEFAGVADELGVRRSVGRTGVCYDNAWAESLNGTLKNERVHSTEYPDAGTGQERYRQLHRVAVQPGPVSFGN
jgi:transposase InsO family protein